VVRELRRDLDPRHPFVRRLAVNHKNINSSKLGVILGAFLAVLPVSAMFQPHPLGQMNFMALDLSRPALHFQSPMGGSSLGGWEARAQRVLPGALTQNQFMPQPITLSSQTLQSFYDIEKKMNANRNAMDLMWMYHFEPFKWQALHQGNEKLANLPFGLPKQKEEKETEATSSLPSTQAI